MTVLQNEKVYDYGQVGIHKKNPGQDTTTYPIWRQIGTNYRTGTKVSNYKYLIDTRQNASSAYQRNVTNVKRSGRIFGTGYYPAINTSSEVWGFTNIATDVVDQFDTVIRDIALKKLKGKLSRDINDFNLLVPLGELTELHRTIRGTYSQIKTLLQNLYRIRHGRIPRGNITKYAADVWLNFSFGINPMINDVNDILDSIDAFKNRKDRVKRYTGRHSKTWQTSSTYTPQLMVGTTAKQVYRFYHSLSYKFIAAQDLRLLSANDYSIYNHLHLSPTEIIPVVWELLPWSWLVDYIANVGEYLTDFYQSVPGSTIYCIENKKYVRRLIIDTDRPTPSQLVRLWQCQPHVQEDMIFHRFLSSAIPHRMLRWRTPYELEQNSTKKLLNLVSILRGRIRS